MPQAASAAPSEEAESHHAVAIYVEGAKNDDVRKTIAAAFPEGVEILAEKDVKTALGKAAIKLPLAGSLTVAAQRKALLPKVGKAAADLKADGLVIGWVKKKGAGQEVQLLYVEAGASDAAVDSTVPVDNSLEEGVKSALEPEIAPMRPKPKEAPKDEPKPEPKPDQPEPKSEGRPKNTHGREILSAFVGFDLGGRFFSFTDGLTSNLRDYDVFGVPGIALSAEVYPMAMLDVPVIQGLGVVGDFRIALGLGSETTDGTKVETAWNRFDVGLRFRQALAKQTKPGDKAVVLGVRGTFGRDAFLLTAPAPLGDEAPGVEYFFMRGGLDATFPAGPILLGFQAGYLGALSSGSVYERMRGSSIGGVDLSGGVTVPLAAGFEARLTGEYVRWFYDFDPRADDKYVAGGAVDQYVHIELGPGYVF
ncbi:MAG: hypothetical protein U0414_16455 [Polyangiaceae bacterium]